MACTHAPQWGIRLRADTGRPVNNSWNARVPAAASPMRQAPDNDAVNEACGCDAHSTCLVGLLNNRCKDVASQVKFLHCHIPVPAVWDFLVAVHRCNACSWQLPCVVGREQIYWLCRSFAL
eukprot:jgi/Ulvmu1/11349/UM075_0009.1